MHHTEQAVTGTRGQQRLGRLFLEHCARRAARVLLLRRARKAGRRQADYSAVQPVERRYA